MFLLLLSVTACQSSPAYTTDQEETRPDTVQVETQAPNSSVETAAPDCQAGEINPIGQSIADDYESITYEQVMTWFCNGAEFEDILVALETEAETDTTAGDMLKMLADGRTWEEIWQIVGLTN